MARQLDVAAFEEIGKPEQFRLENLDEATAFLLNFEKSYLGFRGQAGLWINSPIEVEYREGAVVVTGVNERIIEVPYALQAASELPAGSRVLDFGACESTLALSLASLGYNVTAVDMRPYPFEHDLLTSVVTRVEDWEPDEGFDAIFSISTVEHVGLGAYGESPKADPDLDIRIVERFRDWLKPQGRLVLTAPYGEWAVDHLQRTYDAARLTRMFRGWRILDERFAFREDDLRWLITTREPPGYPEGTRHRGIVLTIALPGP